MQLHFRNRMFDYNKILKIMAIIMFYHIVSIFPYISGYHIHQVLRIDIEQLISSFHEMIFLLTLFSIGVSFIEANAFARFLIGINYAELLSEECVTVLFDQEEIDILLSLK